MGLAVDGRGGWAGGDRIGGWVVGGETAAGEKDARRRWAERNQSGGPEQNAHDFLERERRYFSGLGTFWFSFSIFAVNFVYFIFLW